MLTFQFPEEKPQPVPIPPLFTQPVPSTIVLPKSPLVTSNPSFPARTPVGVSTIFIGWKGLLWRWGVPQAERRGQTSVCRSGEEAKYIAVNAIASIKLPTLGFYVSVYRQFDVSAQWEYAALKMKSLEATMNVDIQMILSGQYDASFSAELKEIIQEICERREKTQAHPTLFRCSMLQHAIHYYETARSKWLAMQAKLAAEPIPSTGENNGIT